MDSGDIIAFYSENQLTDYIAFMSYTMLVWDHIITFDDEVEYMWKGPKGLPVYLFFLNRYLTPLGFIVNLIAYLSSFWTLDLYEGVMTVTGINVSALMMLIRVNALYSQHKAVLVLLATVLTVELAIQAYLLSTGIPVEHFQFGIHSCTMIFEGGHPALSSASAWLPLLYDTLILCFTVFRTIRAQRYKTSGRLMRVMLKDGLLYYSVIFAINFVLTVMIAAAPPAIQNLTAQTEYLLTVAMISRITLNLRKQAHYGPGVGGYAESTMQSTRLSIIRSAQALPSLQSTSYSHVGNTVVNVTVEEYVTRDHSALELAESEPVSSRSASREQKHSWYEMQAMPKFES